MERAYLLLEELAVHALLLIAVDDVQWADRLTRFALRVLPARLAGSPVVWAVTSRWVPRSPLEELIAGVDDAGTVTRIPLGPLTFDDIESLATDRLGAAVFAQTRSLLGGVGGNPFWAVQVTEGLARRQERGQGVGDLHAELSVGVRARLEGLSEQAAALAVADRLLAVAVEPEIVARIELQACRALWCAGDCVQMERRAGGALARDGVSAVLRAQLSAAQALAASRTQSAAHTEAMARVALAEGNRLQDSYSQRLAVVALIEAARNEGRHRLALDRFTHLRRLSDSAYQDEEIRTLQHLDRYDDAEAMLAKIREAYDDVDNLLPSMLYAQMWQDHNLARFDAAEAGARTLLILADETGNYGFRLNARIVLAAIATYRGDLPRATELFVPDLNDHEASDERRVPRLRLMQGWLKAIAGDFDAGLAILGPLLDKAEASRDPWPWSPPWMRMLARIGLDAGDLEFACKAAHIADLVAQRNPGVATFDGAALHIRGLLADDPDVLADAVGTLRESPRPLLLADALNDLGSILLNQDRTDEGIGALVEAAEIYQRVGAVANSRAVAKRLRRRGIRGVRINHPAPRPPTGWAALTPTELRVVELISVGHTNRSAAEELGVSPNTVNTHLRAVFRKLDVKSRVQLTIAFREHSASDGPPARD